MEDDTFQECQTCLNMGRAANSVLKMSEIAVIPRPVDMFEVLEVLEAVEARNCRKAKSLMMFDTLRWAHMSFFFFFCGLETSFQRMMDAGCAGRTPDLF